MAASSTAETERHRVRPIIPGDALSTRVWLLRLGAGGLLAKLAEWGALAAGRTPSVWQQVLGTLGSLAWLVAAAWGLWLLFHRIRRRFEWRVRHKLVLSYVFAGVVPVLLAGAFALLVAQLLLLSLSSFLVRQHVMTLQVETQTLARAEVAALTRAPSRGVVLDSNTSTSIDTRYRWASMVVVPVTDLVCPAEQGRASVRMGRRRAGPWAHLDPPRALPPWVTCGGFAGLVGYRAPLGDGTLGSTAVMRAVVLEPAEQPQWAVVVDLPVSQEVREAMQTLTGLEIGEVSSNDPQWRPDLAGRRIQPAASVDERQGLGQGVFSASWLAFLDAVDWSTGRTVAMSMNITTGLLPVYRQVTDAPTGFRGLTVGGALLAALVLVGGCLLIVQAFALYSGFALARQITDAVDDLADGTARLRARDFTHVIPVRARDQLGELSASFNAMTGEVRALLGEVAQKERLDQEMRAARAIQQQLLPEVPTHVAGLDVLAYCTPAREVAGDYYDFLPITDTMMGVLIADVAGKGLAAGLYMAQLKVIVQSLSHLHHEPREFLRAVNRIVSRNIDPRSFITMTYGVIDLDRRELTLARAGHAPLMRLARGAHEVDILAPDGMVVGLTIDDGEMFESVLEQRTVPLAAGDLLIWFTDGITEAMTAAHECYGEARLAEFMRQHADAPLGELRAALEQDLDAFTGHADPHDDMTMILVRLT
jgi:serine phosphatase RsbU (regulator of sigma subunit)